ncbi:MAG: Asp-tRNA(Asn)/Glu-tRNA(Gln) amidotransferase subunit GatB [Synergistaceae bacterium]|nr:Asp-tRNA(Asn)/Glu-tRNA(Gln) amidotransferase subunit GatB [Synergistaceae bacterium]MBQ9404699.1 Asp-tRNA(Asn)/Glu-tRNA(Gln) amidotransferase subunit GatB [Synergistaceae bacterium]MBQ9594821.1 Asp-tRNA(Asn)/Glu-tRNA(Gln) amidotransferase subunit GatB [Synergistaceae bacterium]
MAELTFTPVIGIEIHIRLKSDSKIFCSCSTNTDAPANTNICPVCMGLPGSLPHLNHRVVEQGMLAGLALNCGIRPKSLFFRKSYFYPDLPKGHQISQCDLPITTEGYIEVHDAEGNLKKIRVHHLHLEEDVGSLHHSASDGRLEGADTSYVDYNRSGTPLAEIVSEPDVASAAEAVEYVTTLRRRVIYSGASDVELEKGMMRFDANVSMKCSDGRWGHKVEVKNMNSFKALERAIEFEIKRQKKIMLSGGEVIQETRHWNDAKGVTTGSRLKEFYRKFIVEPDLPPLFISQEWIDRMKARMPEMPDVRANRYVNEMNLPREVADFITDDKNLADYFESCVKAGANPVRAAHWVRTEVLRVMNEKQLKIQNFMIKPEVLAGLVTRVEEGKLSTTQGKEVFDYMCSNNCSVDDAVNKLGITEGGVAGSALDEIIKSVLAANPDVLNEIKSGLDKKGKKLKFLQGLVMKESKGQAKPQEVAEAIAQAVK